MRLSFNTRDVGIIDFAAFLLKPEENEEVL